MKTDGFKDKGVFNLHIPPIVLKKDNLNCTERILLIIIAALDNDRRGCYLSNAQLGWLAGCSSTTVSKSVNRMHRLKYITINKQSNVNGGRSNMRKVSDDVKCKPA